MFVAGCLLLVACCWLLVACRVLLVVRCVLFVVRCVWCSLFIIGGSLVAVCCVWFVGG